MSEPNRTAEDNAPDGVDVPDEVDVIVIGMGIGGEAVAGKLAEAADDPLSPSNTHVFLCGNPAMIGYVAPGAEPPAKPGMLPLLEEAGFSNDAEGAGSFRFEKYW